ncbi:MAG: 16S rRNA (guanine(966)-N(2))-methyltransferase RsmD [Clostridia bacterium]|nr:16S rRNA (guanine(966)-N(2))-methyltransferase RsmD [Clostridia bacterium]
MMRIITGKAKGVRLASLPGDAVRPTTEMAKEGVFSAIQFDLNGKSFLDLFAGSGQMGLEAISRGAAHCTFVDCSEDSLKIVRKNIEKTGFSTQSRVIRSEYGEYIKSASKRGQNFDYIFADPPYEKDLSSELIKRILRGGLLKAGGLLMVEGANEELDTSKIPESVMETIESIKKYKFSKCYVYFVRTKEENSL